MNCHVRAYLRDSPNSPGPRMGMVTDYKEWAWIVRNIMLIGRNNHYYVRKGGVEADFETAFDSIIERIIALIGDQLKLPESETSMTGGSSPAETIFLEEVS